MSTFLKSSPAAPSAIAVAAALIASVAYPGSSAQAVPIFSATAQVSGAPIESQTNGSGVNVGVSNSDVRDEGARSGNAIAVVDTQRIAIAAHAAIEPVLFEFAPDMFGFGRLSSASGGSAFVRYFDVVFSDENGASGDVSVATRLSVDGVLSAPATPGLSSAGVSVDYGLGVPGAGSTAVAENIGAVNRSYNSDTLSTSATGVFTGLSPNQTAGFDIFVETPSFLVPLDTPVSLAVGLNASASVTTQDGDRIRADVDFSQTLRLGFGGQIFTLPDGVTANSVSAGIVNNQMIMATTPTTPVPLPPSAALMAAALLGLAGLGRRRARACGAG